jgi:hypothetical protein
MSALPASPRTLQPLTVESVGQPVALSSLARLLLQLHQPPALRLVHDQPRDPVPAELEGPQ